ncbi:hypothetical protein LP419_17825 [Massilia sp. H-1]|nr:hypothetical protein LP419_17825 [Massilia sp. H-1]
MLEMATTELLSDDYLTESPVHPQTAPVIEEIAIMYANDQKEFAEQMLQEALRDVGLYRLHRLVDAVRPVPGHGPPG